MNWLYTQMKARPQEIALRTLERDITWQQFGLQTRRLAAALKGIGVDRGSRVAVLIDDSVQFATTAFAVAWLGAALVPLNRRLSDRELSWILDDIEPNLFIMDAQAGSRNLEIADKHFVQVEELTLSLDCAPVDFDESSIAVIMYTSGTTGPPKPVPLTWSNIQANAAASAFNLGIHRDDVWMCVMPTFHIGGLSILYRGALYGTATFLLDRFDEEVVLSQLPRATLVSLVPTMLHRLIAAGLARRLKESRLRAVLLGGGPADPSTIAWCQAQGLPVMQTYGMTETASQITTMPFESIFRLGLESPKWASAGLPMIGASIEIRDENMNRVPAGEVGSIFVRGPMLTAGYLDRPTENARRFVDGWFDSGDFGAMDSDGFLEVKTRRDDLIVTGGENVYPAEIESTLRMHPRIQDCAVFGLPDDEWGQKVCAAVVSDLEPADIVDWASRQMARFKVPKMIWRVEELPRTASGKLRHASLRERFGQHEMCRTAGPTRV